MKESDIRPKDLLERYLELSLRDAGKMDRSRFVDVPCPACRNDASLNKLEKNGFRFRQCLECGSLFCSPRPDAEALRQFYETGESSGFWVNVFFPAVAEPRRTKLFRPKAERVAALMREENKRPLSICDVGAGYGIFLEELKPVFPGTTLHAVEPGHELAAVCRSKGFETLVATGEDATVWRGRFDLVLSSEVLEHVFSPEAFGQSLFNLAKPGGNVLLTGLGYEGFDILVLQETSNSIFPPHHINFLSTRGLEALCRIAGFRSCKVWTPGQLDVDIVMNSGQAPEFLRVMSTRPGALEEFQSLLSRHRLSSHVWVLASK